MLSPIDLGSYSSRVTLMGGNAVQHGRRRGQGAAPRRWRADSSAAIRTGSTARDGRIFVARAPGSRHGLGRGGPAGLLPGRPRRRHRATTSRRRASAASTRARPSAPRPPTASRRPLRGDASTWRPATSTVDRFTDFSDAGTVINPVTFHGQVEGGIIMGLGETLLEDTLIAPDGTPGQSQPARLPDPHHLASAPRSTRGGRELRAARALRRQGDRRGLPAARCWAPSPTPSTTPAACGSPSCPSRRRRSWRDSRSRGGSTEKLTEATSRGASESQRPGAGNARQTTSARTAPSEAGHGC